MCICTNWSFISNISVDPYAANENEDLQGSLSRHLPSRAVGTRHGTVRNRASAKRKSIQMVELENEEEEVDESVKAVAAPMHQKREIRYSLSLYIII
jgi:hypothetical protein